MGDSWEDWDTEEVVVPGINGASAAAPDAAKFADEDQEPEEPKWKGTVPESEEVRGARALVVGRDGAGVGGALGRHRPLGSQKSRSSPNHRSARPASLIFSPAPFRTGQAQDFPV